ncbi:MASE1 domain-containing protein, partial [Shewanella sp. Sh95]|uniref:MASE1 domain-containing protein n=1 Tax=Shewanella sp. Sh95 TaxID=1689868 RepID=UPI0018D0E487
MFLTISISYSFLWYYSWFLPVSFATIGNAASWFLPAGYRFTAFLFLPKKYWPAIIIGEWTAIRLITAERGDIAIISDLIATTVPSLVYLFFASIYLKFYSTPSLKTVKQTTTLLLSSISSAILTSTILTTSMIYHGEIATITQSDLFTQNHLFNIMVFSFGDIIGVILILPLTILIAETIHKENILVSELRLPIIIKILIFMTLCYFTIVHLIHIPLYYIKIISVSIVITCTYKWGWKGAVLSVLMMCILIVYSSLLSSEKISVIENQAYLITIALTAIILGASVTEQRNLRKQLEKNNASLNKLYENYKNQAIKNQKLAARIVNIQEEERKRISTELHDDIGQTLTAIRTEATILQHVTKDNKIQHSAENIKKLTSKVYDVTRNLIVLLHPREVDDLGIELALKSKTLTQLLNQAKVNYHLNIKGDINVLSYENKIAIFRIVQESFNNIVKHANASNVYARFQIISATFMERCRRGSQLLKVVRSSRQRNKQYYHELSAVDR